MISWTLLTKWTGNKDKTMLNLMKTFRNSQLEAWSMTYRQIYINNMAMISKKAKN